MRATGVLWAVLLMVAGCGGGNRPAVVAPGDSERMREAIVGALDAWKRGETRGLARRQPPIRFVDDDLRAGWRLVEYELEQPDAPIRPFEDVPVILSLRDAQGKSARRETHYQVAMGPPIAVLRSDP